jgi:glycosyltransferase involved in cell wall biosynthesis
MDLKKITSGYPYATVVIPAYNEEKTIQKTLQSLSLQKTQFPFNVIVVDNGSEDSTKTIAEEQ